MAKTVIDTTNERKEVITSLDNVVMPVVLETVENGRSLDVSEFTGTHVKGGHLLIKKEGEAIYRPMPINSAGNAYESLTVGFKYVGFQYGTVTKERPYGAIMIRGTVVTEASPYPLDSILDDVKEALPLIHFKTKED